MVREVDIQSKNQEEHREIETTASLDIPDSSSPILVRASQHARRVRCREFSVLNDNEMKSVYALLAYIAYNRHIKPSNVRATVESHFGVDKVENLPQKKYDEVIRFLVDLCDSEVMQ